MSGGLNSRSRVEIEQRSCLVVSTSGSRTGTILTGSMTRRIFSGLVLGRPGCGGRVRYHTLVGSSLVSRSGSRTAGGWLMNGSHRARQVMQSKYDLSGRRCWAWCRQEETKLLADVGSGNGKRRRKLVESKGVVKIPKVWKWLGTDEAGSSDVGFVVDEPPRQDQDPPSPHRSRSRHPCSVDQEVRSGPHQPQANLHCLCTLQAIAHWIQTSSPSISEPPACHQTTYFSAALPEVAAAVQPHPFNY